MARKACNLCREKRVRCQLGSVDAPHKPPCARCRRESKECVFSTTRKRRTKRSTEKAASTEGFPSDTRSVHSGNSPARADHSISPGGSEHRPIVSSSSGEQTAATLLESPAYTANDTLTLLHKAGQHNKGEREHVTSVEGDPSSAGIPDRQSRSRALEAWSNLRFVRSGLFSAEEACAFVDSFYNFLAPFSPIISSDFKSPSQHPKLLEEEPILTVTILMIASRYMKLTGPGALSRSYFIHDRLWKYLQGMISRVFWSEEDCVSRVGPILPFSQPLARRGSDSVGSSRSTFRSLGTCEALLLLLEWHPRALHFPSWDEDTTSIIVKDTGNTHPSTKDTGRYGTLGSGIDWLARSDRMCRSLLVTALSVAVELGIFDKDDNTKMKSNNGQRVYRIQQLIWAYLIQTTGRLGMMYQSVSDTGNQITANSSSRLEVFDPFPYCRAVPTL